MFNLEFLCELINEYNRLFCKMKNWYQENKKKYETLPEKQIALANFKESLDKMEELKLLLKQAQINCEIAELKNKGHDDEIKELEEMLREF